MAAYNSAATGNFNADATWAGSGVPGASDTVTVLNGHVVTLTADAPIAGVTVNTGGTLALGTYALTNSGATAVTGTLSIGTSGGNGLTTANLTFNTGSTITLGAGSVINNSGSYTCANSKVFTTRRTGKYTQTASTNTYNSPYYDNEWLTFTVNSSCTITFSNNSNCCSTGTANAATTINGTLAIGGYTVRIGGDTVTFGSSSDITSTSSGILKVEVGSTVALTFSRTTSFSMTGYVDMGSWGTYGALTGKWANATYRLFSAVTAASTFVFCAGTLECKDFTITNSTTGSMTVINSTYNPNFDIAGNVDFNAGAGSYTTTWTKGTGSMTLSGGNANFDDQGKTIEDLIINSTGTKTLIVNSGTTDSLTITAGTLAMGDYNLTSADGVSITGTLSMGTCTLTCVGLTINAGATMTLGTTTSSNVTNSGNYSCDNSSIWTNPNRGVYTQTGTVNYVSAHAQNVWYSWTQSSGAITLTGNTKVTDINSQTTVISGTIATAGYEFQIGAVADPGSITLNSGFDITGNGTWAFNMLTTSIFTNNKVGNFGLTGTIKIVVTANSVRAIRSAFAANINYIISSTSSTSYYCVTDSGTYDLNDFTITNSSTGGVEVRNTTNNPSWQFQGSVDFNAGAGSYTTTWTKSTTGTITIDGSSGTQTLAWNNLTTEPITHNHAGAIKELSENVTTATCTFSGGTVRSTVAGTQRTIMVTNQSVAASTAFKDISMGSEDRVDASAATNTDLGNTLGFFWGVRLMLPF